MISLTCSNCGETLEVDDAFVGGVCRCQHCGTIQAVSGEDSDDIQGGATTGSGGAGVRTAPKKAVPLYRREEERDAAAASGLDELADVVASSGIMSSGLHRHGRAARGGGRPGGGGKRAEDRAAVKGKPGDRKLAIAIGLAAVFAVVAAGLAVALVSNGGGLDDDQTDRELTPAEPATFAGVTLGRRVVFVVDRGSQTQPVFAGLSTVLRETLEAMPAGDHEFQLIFWSRPDADAALPPYAPGRSPRRATTDTVTSAIELLETVPTGGFTDAMPALQLAVETQPDQVFLVTGKASTLHQKFADDALAVVDGVSTTVHAVAVGNVDEGPTRPLRQISTRTGGQFIALPTASLPK